MKKFLIILNILWVYACTPSEKSENTDLGMEMSQVRVESTGGCDTTCASFEINYPEFKDLDQNIRKKITSAINDAIGYDNPDGGELSMKEKGERFVGDFEKFASEFESPISWYFQCNASPMVITDTLISISVSSEFFTGGAHGGFSTYYVNIDPRDGREVTLESVLKNGYEEALSDAGEASFREIRVIPDSVSYMESGFEFPDDKFQLNQNYGFRTEGIVFFFNNYEIAPYALGPTEIMIPYEVIREWIK